MILFPQLARRVGVGRLILLGGAFLELRAIAVSVLSDPLLVTATMLLHGAGFAFLTIGGVIYVARHAPSGAAATAQGMLTATSYALAMILGQGTSGFMALVFRLPEVFGIASIASIVGVGALAWTLARGPRNGPAEGSLDIEPGPGTIAGARGRRPLRTAGQAGSMGSWISATRSAERSTRNAFGMPNSDSAPNWR